MHTNRRGWLKTAGLALTYLSLAPASAIAEPLLFAGEPEQDDIVRLRSNENPYGPSPEVLKAIVACGKTSNRYGWDMTRQLLKELGAANDLTDANILAGAGSTEIIDFTVRLAARQPGTIVMATPTYDYWCDGAVAQGLKVIQVPVRDNKGVNLEAMKSSIDKDTRLAYICNPNNPTGTICAHNELAAFVQEAAAKTLVLVDEAYLDYSGERSLSYLVPKNKNLVIAKTFSKIYGMAGARAGYAIAHSETIDKLSALQAGANASLSVMTVAGAIAALKDKDFVASSLRKNREVMNFTTAELERLGIPYIPSSSNFLYFSLKSYPHDFFDLLAKNKIEGTRIYQEEGKWTRITIGTMDEMRRFVAAIS
jgi:histidinol-phosphate aminotransferase